MNALYSSILWILAAGVLGLGISYVLSDLMKLSRRVFLIPYVGLTLAFIVAYGLFGGIDPMGLLRHNWVWGVVAAVILSAALVRNVWSQPASRKSAGGEFFLDLAWLGVAYGMMDGLFLNVMPVVAVWNGLSQVMTIDSPGSRVGVGALALAASLFVAIFYHLGYEEFRCRRGMYFVIVGNGLITLAFVLSGNPLGAALGHTVMHIAAVIRGPETTVQLPPHVSPRAERREAI